MAIGNNPLRGYSLCFDYKVLELSDAWGLYCM